MLPCESRRNLHRYSMRNWKQSQHFGHTRILGTVGMENILDCWPQESMATCFEKSQIRASSRDFYFWAHFYAWKLEFWGRIRNFIICYLEPHNFKTKKKRVCIKCSPTLKNDIQVNEYVWKFYTFQKRIKFARVLPKERKEALQLLLENYHHKFWMRTCAWGGEGWREGIVPQSYKLAPWIQKFLNHFVSNSQSCWARFDNEMTRSLLCTWKVEEKILNLFQ